MNLFNKILKPYLILVKGDNFDDNENLYVDLCYFPLIGRDLTSNNHKVYVPAKVFVRKNQQIQKD